jgi:hypothetical protein
MQPQPNGRIFEAIVGRALLDADYRSRLTTQNEEAQIAALMEAGLSEADASALLPQLNEAAGAVNGLAESFRVSPYAA